MKPLTASELEILTLMAAGLLNPGIGAKTFRSHHTVKTHKMRIFRKLGAKSSAHAVALAYEAGILQPKYLQHPAITSTLDTMRKGEAA